MKNSGIVLVFAVLTLVAAGAAEELMPKFLGVGFPFLLAAVPFFAVRTSLADGILFALAAGAMEDALSSLPFATSLSFFTVFALIMHRLGGGLAASVIAFPVYQIWLKVWMLVPAGGIWWRIALSPFVAALAAVVTTGLLMFFAGRAGLDEQE